VGGGHVCGFSRGVNRRVRGRFEKSAYCTRSILIRWQEEAACLSPIFTSLYGSHMTQDSETSKKIERAFVDLFLEFYGEAVPREEKRSDDASKWTLAALLAVNGGGVLGVLNAGERFKEPYDPIALFLVGMSLAVLSAAAIRISVSVDIKIVRNLYGIAKRANAGHEDIKGAYDQIMRIVEQPTPLWRKLINWMPVFLEIISGIFFIFGALASADRIDPDSQFNLARCLALQNDFLNAHPRRSDSREIFDTLKCRPQGRGGISAPPTDREKRVGHPLPWGGYPPPTVRQ